MASRISRSLMPNGWASGLRTADAGRLYPEEGQGGERIFADETTLPTLGARFGQNHQGLALAYARDDRPYGGTSPPMVAYRFGRQQSADCVTRHLSGFTGILQVDGYSAYTNLAKTRAKTGSNETVQLAGCWAHLRRKFYDLHISGVSQAATGHCPGNDRALAHRG